MVNWSNYGKNLSVKIICIMFFFVENCKSIVYTEFVFLGPALSKSKISVTLGQNVKVSRVLTLVLTVTKVLTWQRRKGVTMRVTDPGCQPRSDLSWPVAWTRNTPATHSPGALWRGGLSMPAWWDITRSSVNLRRARVMMTRMKE